MGYQSAFKEKPIFANFFGNEEWPVLDIWLSVYKMKSLYEWLKFCVHTCISFI